MIMLGSAKSNPHLRELPVPTAYKLVPGEIQVVQPLPGEPRSYRPIRDATNDVTSDYILVARLPGLSGSGYLMAISSDSTAGNWAGADYLTERHYARELVQKMAPAEARCRSSSN